MHVYRTITDPKSRVEIVCAEQVVGVYDSSGYHNVAVKRNVLYEDDEHDLKIDVLRRSRQLLPAFAEIACYPDLVGDDVELQDDSMTEVMCDAEVEKTSLNVKLKPRSEVSRWTAMDRKETSLRWCSYLLSKPSLKWVRLELVPVAASSLREFEFVILELVMQVQFSQKRKPFSVAERSTIATSRLRSCNRAGDEMESLLRAKTPLSIEAVVRRVEADIRATTKRIASPSFWSLKLPATLRDADVVTDGARTAEPSCGFNILGIMI
ncbi:hypothetical protein F2Q69_00043250 [Brassica cretica]|uniref:Uncharacterized protein n=1 Tax=Brassica cretica TaxID=69181 RepID=A0A8S9NE82_BRACR|nr:hypothetical protein F2Q69_00043250 [Brassica cretica]